MRPKYYFPRHVKRQVLTNGTRPEPVEDLQPEEDPTPTNVVVPPTNSPELETRQSTQDAASDANSLSDLSSFISAAGRPSISQLIA